MEQTVRTADDDIVSIRNEAFLRIGRNVILFQDLERVLKYLALAQHPSMPLSEAKTTLERRLDSIQRFTLGRVALEVVPALFAGTDSESASPDVVTEPWLSFSFRVAAEPELVEEWRKRLTSLVDERNDLVHHLLSRWNLHDIESCRSLAAELDEQRLRIIREIEKYRGYAQAAQEAAKVLHAFHESEEGRRHFDLAFLQQSRLVSELASLAGQHARPDGWALLSVAGSHLQRIIPEEFARMKAKHGEGSLQRLLVATEMFQIQSELMSNGGTRALYRVRDDCRGSE